MSVPKAAVDKYYFVATRENQIGGPRQVPWMLPIAATQPMDKPTNFQLRASVSGLDRRHRLAPRARGEMVLALRHR